MNPGILPLRPLPLFPNRSHQLAGQIRMIKGTNSLGSNTTSHYYTYGNIVNQYSSFWIPACLDAGNYLLSCMGWTAASYTIVSFTLDSVWIGDLDWYSASSVTNVTKTLNFTVLTPGEHDLIGVHSKKNASSSAYGQSPQVFWIKPATRLEEMTT